MSPEKLSIMGVRNLGLPCPQFSWFSPNTKARRWNHRLTPRSHFLEGELIHWVYKAKNVYIIVDPLLIKTGWWDASVTPQGFSQNIANAPNYRNRKIKLSTSPIIGLNKKVYNIKLPSLYILCPPEEPIRTFVVELSRANRWATDM